MSTAKSILVVDDVPEILRFFEQVLSVCKASPLEVVTLSDSEEALALVSRRDFDVIVSDFRMPHVDGIRILTAAHDRNPHGIRVIMTGYNEIPASPEQLKAASLDARIPKPVTTAFLHVFLEACFSERSDALDAYSKLDTE
jgi:DNA-binding NtrC family response regulator